ncbi:uncharacterized protein LOC128951753 [Oppia nitens]|uniref:uncharacterized protein LOC128951753 n=1 Tax=Oppia nitens TaxID=1686743 RepID=UPI0023DC76F9|nr:uncharacterized protein LOC128951753 [Oppia nitens]
MLATVRPTLMRQLLQPKRYTMSGIGRSVNTNDHNRRCLHWLADTLDIDKFCNDFNKHRDGYLKRFDFDLLNTRYVTDETIWYLNILTTCCPLNESKLFANNRSLKPPNDEWQIITDDESSLIRVPKPHYFCGQLCQPSCWEVELFVYNLVNFFRFKYGFGDHFKYLLGEESDWNIKNTNRYERFRYIGNRLKALPDKRLFMAIHETNTDGDIVEGLDDKSLQKLATVRTDFKPIDCPENIEKPIKLFQQHVCQLLAQLVCLADNNVSYNFANDSLYGLLVRDSYFHFYETDVTHKYIEDVKNEDISEDLVVKHMTDGIGLNYDDHNDRQLIQLILFTIFNNEKNRING